VKSAFMLSFYFVDTNSFVELFCINKDRPKLACNGKCELSKLIESNSSKEKPAYLDFLDKELVFFWYNDSASPILFSEIKKPVSKGYNNLYRFLQITDIKPPPIV
jgi:hypothetical protein